MASKRSGLAAAGVTALLLVSACGSVGPAQVRGSQPTIAFSRPAGTAEDARRDDRPPAHVRRDAYGRRIYFREVPLDRHRARQCGDGRCGEEDRQHREDGQDGDS
jgi:hypothetical protein